MKSFIYFGLTILFAIILTICAFILCVAITPVLIFEKLAGGKFK